MADNMSMVGGSIVLETSGASASLKELRKNISTFRRETEVALSQVEGGKKSIEGMRTKIQGLTNVLDAQTKILDTYKKQLADLQSAEGDNTAKIAAKTKQLDEAQIAYNKTSQELNRYKTALAAAEEKQRTTITSLDSLGDSVSKVSPHLGNLIKTFANVKVAAATAALYLGKKMVEAVTEGIQAFAEYESAFTNVRKTVEGTEADFESLNSSIQQLAQSTPHTAAEIAEIAALGGQMGIGVDSLAEFTETMLALGDATNVTAEDAAELTAQIANLTGMTSEDYSSFGSSLTALGNNFATTESKILDMTNSIATFGSSVGLTTQDVLAISTALSAMGQESDASSTAVYKIMTKLQKAVAAGGDELEQYAEIAGLTGDELAALWDKSSITALQAFTSGLSNLSAEGEAMSLILEDLDIKETRLSKVLTALAGNTALLDSAIKTANTAWDENIALAEETERQYETYNNQVKMTKNTWELVAQAIGERFVPIAKEANATSGELAATILGIVDPSTKTETAISAVKTAMGEYKTKVDEAKAANEEVAESFTQVTSAAMTTNLSSVIKAYEDAAKRIDKANDEIANAGVKKTDRRIADTDTLLMTAAANVKDGVKSVEEALALADNVSAERQAGNLLPDVTESKINNLITVAQRYKDEMAEVTATIDVENAKIATATAQQETLIQQYALAVSEGVLSTSFIAVFSQDFADAVGKEVKAMSEAAAAAEKSAEAEKAANDAKAKSAEEAARAKAAWQADAQAEADKQVAAIKSEGDAYTLIADKVSYYESQLAELAKTQSRQTPGTLAYEQTTLAIAGVSAELAKYQAELKALSPEYDSLSGYVNAYGTELEKAKQKLADLTSDRDNLKELQAAATKGGAAWEEYAEKIRLVETAMQDQEKVIADLGKTDLDSLVSTYGTDAQKLDLQKNKLQAIIDQLTKEQTELKLTAAEYERYTQVIGLVTAAMDNLGKSTETEADKAARVAKSIAGYVAEYGTEAQKLNQTNIDTQSKIDAMRELQLELDATSEEYKLLAELITQAEAAGDSKSASESQAQYATLAEYINAYGTELEKAKLKKDQLETDINTLKAEQAAVKDDAAAYAEYADKIRLATDAYNEQAKVVDGLEHPAQDMADELRELADYISEYGTETQKLNQTEIDIDNSIKSMEALKLSFAETSAEYKLLEELIAQAGAKKASLGGVAAEFETLAEYIEAYGTELEQAELKLDNLTQDKDNLKSLQAGVAEGSEEWVEYEKKIEYATRAIEAQQAVVDGLKAPETADTSGAVSAIKQYGTEADKVKAEVADLTAQMDEFTRQAGLATDPADVELFTKAIGYLKDEIDALNKSLEPENFDMSNYSDMIADFAGDAGTAYAETAGKVQTLEAAIASLEEGIAQAGAGSDYGKMLQISLDNAKLALDEAEARMHDFRLEPIVKGSIIVGYTLVDDGSAKDEAHKWWQAFADELAGSMEGDDAYSTFARKMQDVATTLEGTFGAMTDYLANYGGQVMDALSGYWGAEIDNLDSQIDALQAKTTAKISAVEDAETAAQAALDAQRAAGEISEIEYYKTTAKNAQKAAKEKAEIEAAAVQEEEKLAKQRDELARKQFEAQKANDIAQATAAGAMAIIKCFSSLGPIAGAIAAGLTAVATGLQIATIAKQQYVPALATGGVTTGPTMALIGDNKSGQEAVIPLEDSTMQMLAGKIVDAMNRPNNNVTYNSDDHDARSFTINQTITPAKGMSQREAYLQARKALRDAHKY